MNHNKLQRVVMRIKCNIHYLHKYLPSAYCVSGSTVSSADTTVTKLNKVPALIELTL